MGIGGLRGTMLIKGAPVSGATSFLYGSAFILWGLSALRLDRTSSESHEKLRFVVFLVAMLLIIAGTVSLFS